MVHYDKVIPYMLAACRQFALSMQMSNVSVHPAKALLSFYFAEGYLLQRGQIFGQSSPADSMFVMNHLYFHRRLRRQQINAFGALFVLYIIDLGAYFVIGLCKSWPPAADLPVAYGILPRAQCRAGQYITVAGNGMVSASSPVAKTVPLYPSCASRRLV